MGYLYPIFGYSNFLYTQVPVYLLAFSVLFILLAKLMNSAANALPVAVLVTAATGSYFLVLARHFPFFLLNELAAFVGFGVLAFFILKLFTKI